MLFSLVLSAVLSSNVVDTAVIEQGLSYEQCVAKSVYLQEISDKELESGDYGIVATKAFCIVNKE